ncbi:MAG: histidine kinase [Chloroflexota bacterium]
MRSILLQENKEERAPAVEGWRLLLAPRPFTFVPTFVYLAGFVYVLQGDCAECGTPWKGAIVIGGLLALLALDRLDYLLYGETPPFRVGLTLLALRVIIGVAVASLAGWWYENSFGMFLLVLIPYIAALYAGTKVSMLTGAAIWILFAIIQILASFQGLSRVTVYKGSETTGYYVIGPAVVSAYISSITLFAIVLVFVLTAARIASLEKAHTARSKRLLVELETSYARLRSHSERAIADTEERNQAARDIHDRLGHYLTAVSVQISNAIAYRDIDKAAAGQAINSAKRAITQALQDVRRSVAALRVTGSREDLDTAGTVSDQYDLEVPEAKGVKGWVRWLNPRPFDLVSTTFYAGIFIMDIVQSEQALAGPGHIFAAATLFVTLALIDRLDFALFGERPPMGVGLVLLAVRIGIICLLFFGLGIWTALLLVVLIPYFCLVYFGDRAAYIAGVLTFLLSLFAIGLPGVLVDSRPLQLDVIREAVGTILIVSFMLAVAVATSRTVGKESAARKQAERLFSELQETHGKLATLSQQAIAAIEERNGMARDIHDGMGHYLTAMSVQLEKALAFREIDGTAADQALDESKRLAGEALLEVRNTIGALDEKQETISLARSLAELARHMEHSDLTINVYVEGKEDGYSGQAHSALYRAAQEGLTNIRKHAHARSASIRLVLGAEQAALDIQDDGRGMQADKRSPKGYGLQSMKERLELAGGSLEIDNAPGGGVHLSALVPRLSLMQSDSRAHLPEQTPTSQADTIEHQPHTAGR